MMRFSRTFFSLGFAALMPYGPKSALFSYSPAGKVLFTPAQEARNHHPQFEPPVKSLPMSSPATNAAGSASQVPKRKNLSNSERAAVIHDLLADSKMAPYPMVP